jgi:uncharacterized protein YutE (UPF0331/DUF86 family)
MFAQYINITIDQLILIFTSLVIGIITGFVNSFIIYKSLIDRLGKEIKELPVEKEKELPANLKLEIINNAIKIEKLIRNIAEIKGIDQEKYRSVAILLNYFLAEEIVDKKFNELFKAFWQLRNYIVHGVEVPQDDLVYGHALSIKIISHLEKIKKIK